MGVNQQQHDEHQVTTIIIRSLATTQWALDSSNNTMSIMHMHDYFSSK